MPRPRKRAIHLGEQFNPRIHKNRRVTPPDTLRQMFDSKIFYGLNAKRQHQSLLNAIKRGDFPRISAGTLLNLKTGKPIGTEYEDRRKKRYNYTKKKVRKKGKN